MYTRSYFTDNSERPILPDNYDGTVFKEQQSREEMTCTEEIGINKKTEESEGVFSAVGKIPILSGLFSRSSGSILSGLNLSNIGTEEILIIAAALFLFFSKNGDKECAIFLLFLLLIN